MEEFTGFGQGQAPQGGGLTPFKVLTYGVYAQAGFELGQWLAYQWERFVNYREREAMPRRAQNNNYDDVVMTPAEQREAEEIMFGILDSMVELTQSMFRGTAGRVEDWPGDLRLNVRLAQYVQKLSPGVFQMWEQRNYPTGRKWSR